MTLTFRFTNLVDQGHDDKSVRRQVSSGALDHVRHGGYALDLSSTQPEERHIALIKTTAPLLRADTVISHSSAALLWGLPVPRRLLGKVHVTREGSGGGHVRTWTHTHMAPLEPEDVAHIDGLNVTSLARTAIETAMLCRPHEALQVVDAALRSSRSPDGMVEACEAASGRSGIRAARWALEHADPLSESAGESLSRYWMIMGGVPQPKLQVTITDQNGNFVARPDFVWEGYRVIGEFDGRVKYTTMMGDAADVIMREKRRENRLRALGWWVFRWTWDDLADGQRFAAKLLAFLRSSPIRPFP